MLQQDKKIKVLVVDDSPFFRELLSRGISSDPNIDVVSTANNPFDARDKIIRYEPDVMVCDVVMPRMDGIEFIRRLLPQYPLPVIVVSTVSSRVFDALKAGAVDFMTKPDVSSVINVENFINEMIMKIKIAATANIHIKPGVSSRKIIGGTNMDSDMIIAIGASTGGTVAIYEILRHLPRSTPGIVVAQHIPPVFSRMFAERLNNEIDLEVREARTGDFIEKGLVLIAPGDKHLRIKRIGGKYRVECFESAKVNGHCPSVDILFESVAKEAGSKAIGIILTGMGCDGAKGLLSMRKMGARTIGQDEESSVVYGMPKVAYNIGAIEKQASLQQIPHLIFSMLS